MTVMLYKHPGIYQMHGDYFDYIIVGDDEVEASLKNGWVTTTEEAKSGTSKQKRAKKTPVAKAEEE